MVDEGRKNFRLPQGQPRVYWPVLSAFVVLFFFWLAAALQVLRDFDRCASSRWAAGWG